MTRRVFRTDDGLEVTVGFERSTFSYFAQVVGDVDESQVIDTFDVGDDVEIEITMGEAIAKFRGMGYGANLGERAKDLSEIKRSLTYIGIEIPLDVYDALHAVSGELGRREGARWAS